jgi:translation initiation factor IF-1
MKYTRVQHEDYLNMLGIPEDDKRSNGGRISNHSKYGTWLRRNDKIAFELSFKENKLRYEN